MASCRLTSFDAGVCSVNIPAPCDDLQRGQEWTIIKYEACSLLTCETGLCTDHFLLWLPKGPDAAVNLTRLLAVICVQIQQAHSHHSRVHRLTFELSKNVLHVRTVTAKAYLSPHQQISCCSRQFEHVGLKLTRCSCAASTFREIPSAVKRSPTTPVTVDPGSNLGHGKRLSVQTMGSTRACMVASEFVSLLADHADPLCGKPSFVLRFLTSG